MRSDRDPAGPPPKGAGIDAAGGTGPAAPAAGIIALLGRPNVGKSTLLNRLVGDKVAIVSPVPQTTRIPIEVWWESPAGRVRILDTPGIHRPHRPMNRRMVRSAFRAMRAADLLLVLVDAEAGIGPGDRFVTREAGALGSPCILVINKIDRVRKPLLLPIMDRMARLAAFREIVPISALRGDNCDRLPGILQRHLAGAAVPETIGPGPTEEFRIAETIREQVLLQTRAELPHSTAVLLDRRENRGGFHWIHATLVVEKESQKGILIGRGGARLQAIGSSARRELEARLGARIVLKLWVRAIPNWRDDDRLLERLGLPSGG
ncbi:MAG: GTPase Era [Acidobacteria bacterium]|nr:GTPase Era [Acidobacteriota bacterium]